MAMNFSEEEKKKMLEDESEIYQKRDDGLDANNGQLKKLKGREKRAYFRQYYLGTVAGHLGHPECWDYKLEPPHPAK